MTNNTTNQNKAMELMDEMIEQVFTGTNFGAVSKRGVIVDTLKKYARNGYTGSTATAICRELELITDKNILTELGVNTLIRLSSEPLIEQRSKEFAEWCELEGYRIKGMDDSQRSNLYKLFITTKNEKP